MFLLVLLLLAVASPLAVALLSLLQRRDKAPLEWLLFPLLGAGGLAAAALGLWLLIDNITRDFIFPLGLPWLSWHLHLDPLAGFFLLLVGLVVVAVSLYGPGYILEYRHKKQPLSVLGLFTGLFVTGMLLVVIAADVYSFMIAWELMSISSYFLVAYQHHNPANRRAALMYLIMAEAGALFVLLSFGLMVGFSHSFTFDAMRSLELSPMWASLIFVFSLIGFGMKAGIVPLHIWLPEAHPVAPSHISALMSGVMLKVAIYGFIRVTFDLLGNPDWRWGVALLVIGCITALFGVLYALMQHDLKRLLAYHSVENIGIILIGLALSLIFLGTGHPLLGTLGLIAALYHTLNHAVFKSLLFLGAGAILYRTHDGNMERMGGLLQRMPWTGLSFLIGCISISALPPFNGFVSEWLTFQTALQAATLQSGVMRAVIPIAAASLALTGALAAACFVKVYGIVFLGQARSRRARRSREVPRGMIWGQGLLAVSCLLLGVLPTTLIKLMSGITQQLTGQTLPQATASGWLWLTPISADTASYSAPLVLLGLSLALLVWFGVYLLLRVRRPSPTPRIPGWDCGFGSANARTQYTATAFAMPIRQIFAPVWKLQETVEREPQTDLATQPARIRYEIHAEDVFWNWLYQPIITWVRWSSRHVAMLQTGNLRHYIGYAFVTLILLLWVIT